MNMNLKLDLDLKTILPILHKLQPYVFGLALVGIFGYTAFLINASLNVKPNEVAPAAPTVPKITFDKKTIEAIKKLEVVEGTVPSGGIGKSDPFR